LSFFKKIQERIIPIKTSESTPLLQPNEKTIHEYVDFSGAYRIGIIANYSQPEIQEQVETYKKKLEGLGYECEVLLYIDKKEGDHNVYLPSFNAGELDRKFQLPHGPRTDRFALKKFDLLFNLYLNPCPQLQFISHVSEARCRVAPFLEFCKSCADVLIPVTETENLEGLIQKINSTLSIKPYERKSV